MRSAFHVNDNITIRIPSRMDPSEIKNLKSLAAKGSFQCPNCHAKLSVYSGDIKGVYFRHQHSEACELSEYVESAYKKYEEQTKRESPNQNVIVSLMLNELRGAEKLNNDVKVMNGPEEIQFRKYYPDIVLHIKNIKIAISVITNVGESHDSSLAKLISQRKQYFIEKGFEPIWFVEQRNIALETDKNGIVLWESELKTLMKTKEDFLWEVKLRDITTIQEFNEIINYPFQEKPSNFEISSIYYLSPAEGNNTIKVLRVMEDRLTKPIRAYYLSEPYTITFAQALSIKENKIQLSNSEIEEKNRNKYESHLEVLRLQKAEEIRIAEEARVKKEREKAEEISRLKIELANNNAERIRKQNERSENVWEKPKEEAPVIKQEGKSRSDPEWLKKVMKTFNGAR